MSAGTKITVGVRNNDVEFALRRKILLILEKIKEITKEIELC